jgi:hypothetical protein
MRLRSWRGAECAIVARMFPANVYRSVNRGVVAIYWAFLNSDQLFAYQLTGIKAGANRRLLSCGFPKFCGFALCCRKDVARSASRGTPSIACVFFAAFSAAYGPAAITIEAAVNTIRVWGKICVGTFSLNLIRVVAVGGNLRGRGHIGSEGKHRDCENSSLGDFHVHERAPLSEVPLRQPCSRTVRTGCMTFIR